MGMRVFWSMMVWDKSSEYLRLLSFENYVILYGLFD